MTHSLQDASGAQLTARTPQRTCIGCRAAVDASELTRLALVEQSTGERIVVVDESRRLPGRGAWVHPSPDCIRTAVKRNAARRAFRSVVDDTPLSQWLEALETVHPETSMKAGLTPMETR